MAMRALISLIVLCMLLASILCVDTNTEKLLNRIQNSRPTKVKTTAYRVHHMELDLYRPNRIIYTDYHALRTSDGDLQTAIAGETESEGYKEGVHKKARFRNIYGFTQISINTIIVADMRNHCLRKIERGTRQTSQFSGKCETSGLASGIKNGRFSKPWTIVRDVKNSGRLLVTDYDNSAIRSVSINTGFVRTLVQSTMLTRIRYVVQDKDGDIYVTAYHAVYLITYNDKVIRALSGSQSNYGYSNKNLRYSRYNMPHDIKIIGYKALLVADSGNRKIRLLDLSTDKVSTAGICSGCNTLAAYSLLMNNNSMLMGQYQNIQKFKYPDVVLPSDETSTKIPTKTPTSTPQIITTKPPPCKDQTMTVYVASDHEKAFVHLTADLTKELLVGSHVIHTGGCLLQVNVINNGKSTKVATTTITKPTTSTPAPHKLTPCVDKSMTVYVSSQHQKIQVQITPDLRTELSVGSHMIQAGGCSVHVWVINTGAATTTEKAKLYTTPESTTKAITCLNKNLTYYVASNSEKVVAEITPDRMVELSVGRFYYQIEGCVISVLVIKRDVTLDIPSCPNVIRGVISPVTGLSAVDLTLDDVTHRLELPLGTYNYHVYGKNQNCTLKVEIKDNLLERRLDLVARYHITCTTLMDQVAQSTVISLVNSHFSQIQKICDQDCIPAPGAEAELTCGNDTLTVSWPTDIIFDGSVTELPDTLLQRLTDRLYKESRYPILSLVVVTNVPPVVYPTKTKTGNYAEFVLTTSCLQNKKYNRITDTCI